MRTIDAADYHEIDRVADPRLSPDGERVAFVRRRPADEESYEATVYVVPVGGGEPRRFTLAEGVDEQPRWHPDGDALAFVSDRGEGDRTQVWILPAEGGEARRVTSVVGGVSDLAWSPDGSRLLFTQRVTDADRAEGRDLAVDPAYGPDEPDPRVIDRMIYRSMQRYADGRRSHVYVLDVPASRSPGGAPGSDGAGDGAVTRITGERDPDRDYVAPAWGDDATIYYAAGRGDDSIAYDLYEHDLGPLVADGSEGSDVDGSDGRDVPEDVHGAGDREVFGETTGWVTRLAATTDGRVAYAYTPEERATMRQTEIVVHDRETGDEVIPTEPLDRTLADAGFEWDPAEERLYVATPDEGSVVTWSVPGDASEEPTKVHGDGATVEGFSVGEDAVAYVQSEWDHPGDVFLTTRGGAEAARLTRVNDDYLAARAVPEPEEVWFEGEAGPVQGWVLTPPDFDPGETYPLVVEIHGGPHAMWTTSGTMWHEFQTLAARGYVVFWSNPRGSTGYGEEFATAIERDWGAVTLSDVLAGADAVCERAYVDADEQFVTGGSFGGFVTAWAVGHTDRFRAAAAQRGVYDLAGFYGSTDAFKLVEGDFGTTPWDEPAFLREQSPVSAVPDVETPTLVVHSERDYRTPANTAELFYLGLQKHGVETRLVRYPREGHELSRSGEPGHVVDRIERIVRWFDGYSDRRDAPPALERGRDTGLSASADGASGSEDDE